MTVQELREKLADAPPNATAKVWSDNDNEFVEVTWIEWLEGDDADAEVLIQTGIPTEYAAKEDDT